LRAGGQAEHVLRGVLGHVGIANLHSGGHPQEPEPLGDLGVPENAAADERHLAFELDRQVDQQLHPVDARRKKRDHELAVGAGEQLFEGVDHFDLGTGKPGPIHVGAVGEERQHTPGAELREPMEIEMLAVDRGLIDLEIAGVDDRADRRRDRQRHAVGHAVRHPDEFDGQRPDGDGVARLDRLQAIAGADAVLFELRLDQRQGHRRAVHRAVEPLEHMGHGADVILVPVGEDERLHLLAARFDERQIRNDQIHAELVRIRKHHAGVDQNRGVLPGHGHHVHAELAQASQRDDLERGRRHYGYDGLIHQIPAQRRFGFSTESLARAGGETGYQAAGSA
jgi:hypothetical protein